MDIIDLENSAREEMPRVTGKESRLLTMAIERVDSPDETSAVVSHVCSSLAAHQTSCLGDVVTTFEPLKICLDDDSSIEDGDEDMFDDDAFTFGDEDFETLMSHEVMKRMSASINSQIHQCHSPAVAAQSSHHPLHSNAYLISDKAASSSTDSSHHGQDSMPSTATSSTASLGTLTLTSHASCNSMSKKTRSKRRVSLHNDVAVIPIPMRTEYPNRERIWSSASELYQNAVRNTFEFAAEGFDWRNAVDDSQMVQSPHGERIHPIHFMNIANLGCSALNRDKEIRPFQAEASPTPLSMDMEPLPS